ncbi:MAG: hypothetical protein U0800_11950 [Isosphaeraceae bacterium]
MTALSWTMPPALARLLVPMAVIGLAGLGYLMHRQAPDSEDLGRLQAIPLEQRRAYWEKIREFDRLPAAERRAIEDLDRRLQELPAEERDRFQATLRRYAIWLQSQPPDRRAELASLDVEDRLARLRQYWAEGQAGRDQEATATFFQSAALSPLGLIDSVFLLRTWFAVGPEGRGEIRGIKPLDAKIQRLKAKAAELQIFRDYGPIRDQFELLKSQAFPNAPLTKGRLGKGFEPQGKELGLFRRVEAWYFVNHEPKLLPAAERARFEGVLPDWFRDTTVALPADVAQRRLDLLYEMLFGAEGMPPDLKPDPRPGPPPSPPSRPPATPGSANIPL